MANTLDLRGPFSIRTDTGWSPGASYPDLISIDNSVNWWQYDAYPITSGLFVFDLVAWYASLAVNERRTVYTCGTKKVDLIKGDNRMSFEFIKDNVVMFSSNTSGGQWSRLRWLGWAFGYVNGTLEAIQISYDFTAGNYYTLSFSRVAYFNPSSNTALLNWLGNDYRYGYNYEAVEFLAGNNGQYLCNLTKIKTTSIGQLDQSVSLQGTDFDAMPNQSSIFGIVANLGYGYERDIAWSGNCRMSITKVADQSEGLDDLLFKFYFPNETTPFFTYTMVVVRSGQGSLGNLLLSFVWDTGNMIAAFTPIEYIASGIQTGYWRNRIQETNRQGQDLFVWLAASSAGDPGEGPYTHGTTDTGGDGDNNPTPQDSRPSITVPTLSGMTSGLFTIYCPTDAQLTQIAQFLWSSDLIDNIRKYFNNVADNIISLYVLPHKPSGLLTKNFQVGNMESETITGVEYVSQRFVEIDMGEVYIDKNWGSYLDFSPYTKFEVYLPGIGMQSLDTDELMCPTNLDGTVPSILGSTLKLSYELDLMTGVCVAVLKIKDQICYQFSGKIGYQIPITGQSYDSMARGFMTAAAGLIGTVATAGAAMPFTAGAATAGVVNAMKPEVHRSGNMSGDPSMMCFETPWLMVKYPNKPELVNQQKYTGFPSYKSGKLREFGDYTEVVEVHVEGFVCTEEERDMIIDLLKKGVIL